MVPRGPPVRPAVASIQLDLPISSVQGRQRPMRLQMLVELHPSSQHLHAFAMCLRGRNSSPAGKNPTQSFSVRPHLSQDGVNAVATPATAVPARGNVRVEVRNMISSGATIQDPWRAAVRHTDGLGVNLGSCEIERVLFGWARQPMPRQFYPNNCRRIAEVLGSMCRNSLMPKVDMEMGATGLEPVTPSVSSKPVAESPVAVTT